MEELTKFKNNSFVPCQPLCHMDRIKYCVRFLLLHSKLSKLYRFKGHSFLILQFLRSEVQMGLTGFSTQDFIELKSLCQQGWAHIWRFLGKNPVPRIHFIQVFGRIQFLAVAGLWISFLCYLGSCSWYLLLLHATPSILLF